MTGVHRASRFDGVASVLDLLRTPGGQRVVASVAAALTVIGVSWGGYQLFSQPSCGDQIQLSVAASPAVEPAVRATVQEWTATAPRINDKCVAVEVSSAAPADVAAAIAGRNKATLPGLGLPAGGVRVPDIWIPDSSTWLQRLRAANPDFVPAEAASVAYSPVVLAMPEPVAATLGWPDARLSVSDVLSKLISDAAMRPGIVDPIRDATGLSGLLAVVGAANRSEAGKDQQATTAALRALASGRSAVRADLLARFPRGNDKASLASSLNAAPLSEQAVIAYNQERPPVPLAAMYLEPLPVPLDYPFAVLPTNDRDKAAAALAVNVTLAGGGYRDRLAAAGLRAAGGDAGNGFAAPRGAPTGKAPEVKPPQSATIDKVLSAWTTLTAPGRLLTVLDVSGSMNSPVPTAGGATRSQVTVEASRRGLTLLDDAWAVGLWVFSTELEGTRDWRELVPIGPLSSQREGLLRALTTVPRQVNGGTGLYNTLLAAYRTVLESWDPGRVNGILIMTDGKNEHAGGLTLAGLLTQLKRIRDPARPVQVIALGIGDEVSEAVLKSITRTTGGGTFIARDPAKIGEIFFQAIGLRPEAKGS